MEILSKKLNDKILEMSTKYGNKFNLNEEFLDKLYSVYPFNRFEYVISHLIATEVIDLSAYLEIRNS